VAGFSLADDVDLVSAAVDHRRDRHATADYRAWVAVDGPHDATDLADADGEFVGFVTTDVAASPSVFDRPDRLVVGDLYVRDGYRGTGLARQLLDRAADRTRERGCPEMKPGVHVDNDRAVAFYETLGFEPVRHTMAVDVER
jgi:ribosomal protein S18 acetylase RimI-like enzyme